MSLIFNRVSFSYDGAPVPVFADLTLHCDSGWTGITGANGTGKTTLMLLALGEQRPDSGSVSRSGAVIYCPQRTDAPSPDVIEWLASSDRDAHRLRGLFGVSPAWADRWTSLSHGERKRVQVAAALWREPAVLLLEPLLRISTMAPMTMAMPMARPANATASVGAAVATTRAAVANATGLLGGRDFLNAEHRGEVARLLNLPANVIPERNSWAYDQIVESILAGRIRGLWVVATNPAHSWINQLDLHDVLGRLDLLVVQDMYADTETAEALFDEGAEGEEAPAPVEGEEIPEGDGEIIPDAKKEELQKSQAADLDFHSH